MNLFEEVADKFGFELKRKKKSDKEVSFTPPEDKDGAVVVSEGSFGGQALVNLSPKAVNEVQLITEYRRAALQPEMEEAIDDIVNEAVIDDDDSKIVEIVLDDLDFSDSIKKQVYDEFENVYALYDFQQQAYEIFRNWYVDGRIYYHIIIDQAKPKAGIKELRYIDPRKMKRVKKVKKPAGVPGSQGETLVTNETEEFFIYSEKLMKDDKKASYGTNSNNVAGLKIYKDSIVHVTSGLMRDNTVISHIDAALKPLNSLRLLEDSLIIYRVSRAPERRVFYIDVGNLPKAAAEQYMQNMATKHKNKLVYDPATGSLKDSSRVMTMMEDYWLPRREGGKATEITTLQGGQNLGEIEDVLFFQKKLYRALKVPITRREPEQSFSMGRANDVSRDEIKFSKFIRRLRTRFTHIFNQALERQLVLKGVITPEDWKVMRGKIKYEFAEDNHYAELKEAEIIRERFASLRDVDEYIGRFVSEEYVMRNILRMTEDEIKEMRKEIEKERAEGRYDDIMPDEQMAMIATPGTTRPDATQPTEKIPQEPKKKEEKPKEPAKEDSKKDTQKEEHDNELTNMLKEYLKPKE